MENENLNLNDFIIDEIESINFIGDEETIDITVDETHMFYANDIYTHNSAINAEIVDSTMFGGSIKKGQIGHFILSAAKSLQQKENGTANMAILKSRFGKDGIEFHDVTFNNGTIQIDMSEDVSKGKTFMESTEIKKTNEQQRVNQALESFRRLRDANSTDN